VSYIPIIIIVIGAAWSIRKLQPIALQVFLALIVSLLASAILGVAPEIIKPSTPGEGGMGWSIVLAASYAIVAVPTCLISITFFNFVQRRKEMDALKREEISICTCPCHDKPHEIIHPVECCEKCSNCKRGMARGSMEAHLQVCTGREKDKERPIAA
jgi:hypothetical protein